jgi:predicted ATPase
VITQLKIHNFKCFPQLQLELAPMTLLSGLNSTGKSSILQCLLLLRQSSQHSTIRLKGELTDIGQASDAFCADATDDKMIFELYTDEHDPMKWEYMLKSSKDKTFVTASMPEPQNDLALFNDNFHYLSADRWGPRLTTPLSDDDIRLGNLAKDGRYTIHYLVENRGKALPNPDIPLREEKAGATLLRQVQSWLGEISPGARMTPQLIKNADIGTINFSFDGRDGPSPKFRPTNVGFGLSYTLPIIVALLSLPKGGLVLLENPEAHLHPKGQTLMGKLMAQIAAAGTQVIVETHSDHVLDGIRLAVFEGLIKPKQTCFHYFNRNEEGHIQLLTPKINEEGRIDNWPDGFFDESVRNLSALASRRRRERRKAKEK